MSSFEELVPSRGPSYSWIVNTINRSFVLLFFLLPFCLHAQSSAPAEASGFSGDGLHLFPLGWSSEGRWGALIGSTEGNGSMRFLIMDAVTDEILSNSGPYPWDGDVTLQDFWDRYGQKVMEMVNVNDLESSLRPDVRNARFTTGGVAYEFQLKSPSGNKKNYTLSISSSRGDSKIVYSGSSEEVPDRTLLLGAMVSPFESRALAILREIPPYGAGGVSYRFSGAHLTQGFSHRPETGQVAAPQVLSAVFNGQEYLLRSRIEAGGNPNAQDQRGYSALLVAARLGHWNMVDFLAQSGAKANVQDQYGRSPLHYAAFAGKESSIRALLQIGASKTLRDEAGRTAAELCPVNSLRTLLR
ncbi:MAG: ankyrin repeat domain-containing protein [Spirochaetales bacterium]|nr:ankyrin repeat domain-containing protein [Spirochaetales bacterium]